MYFLTCYSPHNSGVSKMKGLEYFIVNLSHDRLCFLYYFE